MRTVNKVGGANGTIFTEFYGNTTDVKPTEDVPNGSAFYEVDNNMQEYRFDKENKIWYPITRGGTAPSDDYLPLSGGIMTGDINMNGNSLLNAKSITLKDETGEYTVALNLVHLETTNPETGEPFSYEVIEFSNSDDTSKQYVITGVADPLLDTDAANKAYVDQETAKYLPLTGGKMTGNIDLNNKSIYRIRDLTFISDVQLKAGVDNNRIYLQVVMRGTNNKLSVKAADAVKDDELVTKSQMETADSKYLPLTGTTEDNPVTGVVTFNGESTITGVSIPVNDTDVVTKKYVDDIKTELDDKTNQLNEDTTALQKRQNVLVGSETGNPVSCNDAFAAPLCGLNVYGKSTQDGTPSPDNPVPIVSAGDGGSVTVKVTGINMLEGTKPDSQKILSGITYAADETGVRVTGTASNCSSYHLHDDSTSCLPRGVYYLSTKGISNSVKLNFFFIGNFTSDVQNKVINVTTNNSYSILLEVDKGVITNTTVQVTLTKSRITSYSPYREQFLTLPTPNGLPGIPVTSGGNYTDPQGQQWVCDEVDLERGVKVQRVDKTAFDSTKTLAEQNAILSSPIETPLTSDEIAAYKALTAYAPDTVVQVSDGAGIKLDYQRDVNIVIKQLTDTIASMTN